MLTVHMMIKFNYKCMFEVVFVYLVVFMFVFHHNFSLLCNTAPSMQTSLCCCKGPFLFY